MTGGRRIERVAVLGAGVMGAQIAALAANAGFDVDLLDLPTDGDADARARAGIEGLGRLRPAPLYRPSTATRIRPGSFDDLDRVVPAADWVIEAVVEDLPTKRALLDRVLPLLAPDAVLSSNTSGLSIASLAEGRPAEQRRRLLGVHFFNPPRAMKLVEVIPGADTDDEVVADLSRVVEERLGKAVVPCRDTPNFIANRLGVFAVVDAVHRMQEAGLTVEELDALTGTLLGRPRSATLRLCDLIGLDTLAHVAATSHDGLPAHPGRERLALPSSVQRLVEAGHLGAKSGSGFYRKGAGGIEAWRWQEEGLHYEPVQPVDLDLPLRGSLGERLEALWATDERLARVAREHLLATLAYTLTCAEEVAFGLEDVDRALRWGFNWEAGPFELIDLLGAGRLREQLAEAGHPEPPLLTAIAGASPASVYDGAGVLGGDGQRRSPRALTPTDAERLEEAPVLRDEAGLRTCAWGEDAVVIEIRGKLNTLPPAALPVLREEVRRDDGRAAVLTGAGEHFCAGADLVRVLRWIDAGAWDDLEGYVRSFQETTVAILRAPVPVVAAGRGLALGGGCEIYLAAAGRVVAAESRIGLVEARVGVIPGAGGCKEMVRRVGADVDGLFDTLAAGHMTDNAPEAQELGFLDGDDDVRLAGDRLLEAAAARARALRDGGWSAPAEAPLTVAGPAGRDRLQARIDEHLAGGRWLPHDGVVAGELADVLCGGDGPTTTEQELLDRECEAFLRLCGMAATRARIDHMLRTGKPLRN